MTQQIILASQSPQRRSLLQSLGVAFEVVPANLDEKAVVASNQPERARFIAQAKAQKVQQLYPRAIIIAGDTFVVKEEQVFEKPTSLIEAKQMLEQLSGQRMQALTGLCYLDADHDIESSQVVVTEFTFRPLSSEEIDRYINNNPVLTWSAGFSPAYPAGMALIASVSGSFTSFTHGLPLELVAELLKKSGIEF
jgi:septum formation protein